MKIKSTIITTALAWLALAVLNVQLTPALAQGTAFTYQGRLNDGSGPAHGTYDFRFKLFADPFGNNQAGGTMLTNGITMTNGLFLVAIDFGAGIFNGSNYWLEVDVRTNGAGSYANLNPLQPILPTPYAIFASTASNVSGTISSASLSGTYSGPVTFNGSGNSFSGSFTGNGANVTNVNAATLNGLSVSNFWKTTGNAGTVAGVNFVGTADNQPLELHVNGGRALRLEPNTNGAPNVIGGSPNNYVSGGLVGATIAGGGATNYSGVSYTNSVTVDFGTVGGGYANHANGYAAVVSGGYNNVNNGFAGFIGAGDGNVIVGNGGGDGAYLGGGYSNTNGGEAATLCGGTANFIGGFANNAFIGGGAANAIVGSYVLPVYGVIGGGYGNAIQTNIAYATIGGGLANLIKPDANSATIFGGSSNVVQNGAVLATIAGGSLNTVGGAGGFIGGGGFDGTTSLGNYAGPASVVCGGLGNSASYLYSTIGGGQQNKAMYEWDTVGGGQQNTAGNGGWDTVGGGIYNTASGLQATVGGGANNVASGTGAFIGGGGDDGIVLLGNQASGAASVVTGGAGNTAGGLESTVPGGHNNTASGQYSFAAGNSAHAQHDGSFVWADSQASSYSSDRNNQFKIRSAGGVVIDVSGSSGLNPSALYVNSTSANGVGLYVTETSSDSVFVINNAGAGDIIKGFNGGGSPVFEVVHDGTVYSKGFALTSDRNAKDNFATINPKEMLDKVATLPISQWNYKTDAGIKHIGPMAQDFHALFGLNGEDDKHISVVDEGGVALAAIQGLNQKLEQKNAEIETLKQNLAALEKIVQSLVEKK